MKQRLLAFDIETAKPLPDEVTDLLSHCTATDFLDSRVSVFTRPW